MSVYKTYAHIAHNAENNTVNAYVGNIFFSLTYREHVVWSTDKLTPTAPPIKQTYLALGHNLQRLEQLLLPIIERRGKFNKTTCYV